MITLKAYFENVNELKEAVKDGYCTTETYKNRLSVYNSLLTKDQWLEVKQMEEN